MCLVLRLCSQHRRPHDLNISARARWVCSRARATRVVSGECSSTFTRFSYTVLYPPWQCLAVVYILLTVVSGSSFMVVILLICLSGRIGSGSNAAIAAAASQAIAATQQVKSLTTKIPSSIPTWWIIYCQQNKWSGTCYISILISYRLSCQV